ncbi:hypothetical protein SPAN111604_05200 [Sphingomonas antarctica]|uniref:hypothetical protein n=1 Tax=Sphingomonas antarctica TaxID=2040274 RepID=UPI0039E97DCB
MASDPRSRTFGTLLAAVLIAFVAGIGAMALAIPRWQAWRATPVAAAPTTVTQPATATVVPPAQPLATTTLGQAQVIDTRVAEIESRMARVDLRAAAAAGNADRAESLLLAFAARRAVDRGVGLGYVEQPLRQRFGQTQPRAVGSIIGAAQSPVTIAALRAGLAQLQPVVTRPTANQGWWQATRTSLGSLFVVRREGSVAPTPDARLDRARLLVESGQVDGAMTEVARLPQGPQTTAWLALARRYVEAHNALDLIEAEALTRQDPLSPPPLEM